MSVLKVSLVLYLSVLLVAIIAGVILWVALAAMGVTHHLEHFINDLFGLRQFTDTGLQILLVAVLVGLILVILGSLFNVLCAVLYNVTCDVVGGVEVVEIEDAPVPPAPGPRPAGPPPA